MKAIGEVKYGYSIQFLVQFVADSIGRRKRLPQGHKQIACTALVG